MKLVEEALLQTVRTDGAVVLVVLGIVETPVKS